MNAIERRLNKLDKQVAQFPCTKPGHDRLFIFRQTFGEDNLDAETQATIDSINACERCKDKLVVLIMDFGKPLEPVPLDFTPQPRHNPAPVFTYEVESKAEAPTVDLAQWLKDLRND